MEELINQYHFWWQLDLPHLFRSVVRATTRPVLSAYRTKRHFLPFHGSLGGLVMTSELQHQVPLGVNDYWVIREAWAVVNWSFSLGRSV